MLADSYGSRELDAVSIETGTMDWFQISLLLCVCGFLKEIRPSEPYVSDFLQSPYRDVSTEEVETHFLIRRLHLVCSHTCFFCTMSFHHASVHFPSNLAYSVYSTDSHLCDCDFCYFRSTDNGLSAVKNF